MITINNVFIDHVKCTVLYEAEGWHGMGETPINFFWGGGGLVFGGKSRWNGLVAAIW